MADTSLASTGVDHPLAVCLPTLFGGGGGPASLEEIKRRRAIAAALATRQKGYPKTFGEGLTYLGESVGDVLAERRLAEQEKAYREGKAADPLLGPPGTGGRPVATESVAPDAAPTAALPGSTAELSPEADAQRNQLASLLSPEGVAQQNPMVGAPTRAPLGSQLASLNPAGTLSDAPPVMPRVPSPLPPAPLGAMPEPPNPPTPTDIAPMPTMVAQAATGAPVVPGGAAGAPAPPPLSVAPAGAPVMAPAADEYVMPKPVKPIAPLMNTRPTEEELRGLAILRKYPGDEDAEKRAGYLIGFGKTRRDAEYARRVKEYETDLTHFNQLDSKYQDWLANREMKRLQAEEQRQKVEMGRVQKGGEKDRWLKWNPEKGLLEDITPKRPGVAEGDKPDVTLSETQSKTFGNLQTAEVAHEQYKRIPEADKVLAEGLKDELAGKLPFVGNAALTNRYRRARAAALSVADAQQREVSGAAIGVAEEAKALARLFPLYGDDAGTLRQKAELRDAIVTGMRHKLGSASVLADWTSRKRAEKDAVEQAKIQAEMGDTPRIPGKIYKSGDKRRYWTGSRWEDD